MAAYLAGAAAAFVTGASRAIDGSFTAEAREPGAKSHHPHG